MAGTKATDKIKLLIVDDQQIIIDGLTSLLASSNTIEVAGGCSNTHELLQTIEDLVPDVILMDLNMPGMDGIECVKNILANDPGQKILMLTGYDDTELIREALARGAMGYVLKNVAKDELITAIERVYEGRRYLDQQVQNRVIDVFLEGAGTSKDHNGSAAESFNLSQREIEVLKLIAEGKTSGMIAETLFISTNTVDTHRKNIMAKCVVRNIAELVSFANKNGLL